VGDDLTETRDTLGALTPAESLLGMAQAVQHLARNVVKLIEKFDARDARLNQFEATERGLVELLLLLARQRVANPALIAAAPASELNALSHDITEIRQTEKQIQGSLQSIEGALSHIADRLTLIEAKIHGEVGCPLASQLPLVIEEGRLAPPAPTPADVLIAPEQPATRAAAEAEPGAPTTFGRPIDPSPSCNDAPECSGAVLSRHSTAPAEDTSACEWAGTVVKLSVMPDRGGRSEFIAAARRAAQAATAGVTERASATVKMDIEAPADRLGTLHVLIGATAAILLMLGLLQIMSFPVTSSDERMPITPSYTSISPDPLSEPVPGLVTLGEPLVAGRGGDAFHPGSASESETTGKVRLPPDGMSSAAASTGSTSASVTRAPSAASPKPDLATPRRAQ
jgi:hypothetical protein